MIFAYFSGKYQYKLKFHLATLFNPQKIQNKFMGDCFMKVNKTKVLK